jgi:D-alanine-D-alanine ligase
VRAVPRITLVVLYGGRSAEHDVSRVTASHVLRAADPARYDIVPVAIDRDGRWHRADDVRALLSSGAAALPESLPVDGPETDPTPLLQTAGPTAGDAPVVALPLLHGPFGEDGTVQGLLELAGVPYVGAGVLASALAMDKAKAKEVFAFNGIPQAAWLTFRAGDLPDDLAEQVAAGLGYPCFVKPSNMGSSVGVSKVHRPSELADAVALAASYDEWILVEEAVDGREIELAVLGNLEPEVSVAGEIIPGAEFYDYDDKYHDGRAELVIPASLPEALQARFQQLAVAAYRACRAEGLARVDFFLEESGRARGPLLNEVNTIPGFTPISMYPKLWAASGLPYGALLDRLVDLALERHRRRGAITRTDR